MNIHGHDRGSHCRRLAIVFLMAVVVTLAVAAPALATSSVTLRPGWNLVAAGPGTSFSSTLFGWSGSSYVSTTSPVAWQGYWCKVPSLETDTLAAVGGPHTTTLATGWNLIGNPMSGTCALGLPTGRVVFAYDQVGKSYVSTTSLAAGQGGWVKGTATGETVVFPALVPSLSAVAPSSGVVAGGTSVVITGANLTGATAVKFGTTDATSFHVDSDTQITAVAPAGTLATRYPSLTVDITVTAPGGTTAVSSADQYMYYTLTVTKGSTVRTYSLADLQALAAGDGWWGPKKGDPPAVPPYPTHFYFGAPLNTLLAQVGGIDSGQSLVITCSDPFSITYDPTRLADVANGTYEMWDAATGTNHTTGRVQLILAYRMDGAPLPLGNPDDDHTGPVRLVPVLVPDTDNGWVTEGKYSPYAIIGITVQ